MTAKGDKKMNNKTIGFIGAGKMASAIIKGLLSSKTFDNEHIIAAEVNEIAAQKAKENFKIKVVKNANEAVNNSNIILIATKPFVVPELLETIKNDIRNDQLIISIAAGITFEKLENALGKDKKLVRVMPNTPALVECGMSAICKNSSAKEEDLELVKTIFSKIGKVIKCEEKDMDAVTGVSGSGPAFYYYIIDKIAKAGEKLGLDYKTALTLSAQTALGAAKMLQETGNTPEELITAVTTPGGTTAEGNRVLNESNIEDILFETVRKTAEKSAQMSK